MNDHRISRRSFLAAAGMAGATAAFTACFQRSIVRGFLCRRFLASSTERGVDRVCRRFPHRDTECDR